MSAYMIGNETRAIIAKYLAEALNASARKGTIEGIKKIQLYPNDARDVAELRECRFVNGDYSVGKIYRALYNLNRAALMGRYGEKCGKQMAGNIGKPSVKAIDIKEEKRREWLANLYTVLGCFIYQCSEAPNIKSESDGLGGWMHIPCPFLRFLQKWHNLMAAQLAEYVVTEVRGRGVRGGKSWDEF